MVEKCFYQLVEASKNNSNAMMQLIEIMQPLIRSYKKKVFFIEGADAEQELYLTVIEAVKKIPYCKNDCQCLTYISNAVKFKYSYMCKKNINKNKMEDLYKKGLEEEIYLEKFEDIETFFDLQIKKGCMNEKQKKILEYLLQGYTDNEIAKKLEISRQYVNRIKKFY